MIIDHILRYDEVEVAGQEMKMFLELIKKERSQKKSWVFAIKDVKEVWLCRKKITF